MPTPFVLSPTQKPIMENNGIKELPDLYERPEVFTDWYRVSSILKTLKGNELDKIIDLGLWYNSNAKRRIGMAKLKNVEDT